jgi:transcriptional regulator with XRE-family HTH domain
MIAAPRRLQINPESRKLIGAKIRKFRHQHGWHLAEVAQKLGISTPALSKIETGVTDISVSRMKQISNLYNVSMEALFIDENKAPDILDEATIQINNLIAEKEQELLILQRRAIELLEEVSNKNRHALAESIRYINSDPTHKTN